MTDTARDVIARALPDALNTTYEAMPNYREYLALNVLLALRAAGYRILAPGELDRETVERCADAAQGYIIAAHTTGRRFDNVPEAIRSLKGGRNA